MKAKWGIPQKELDKSVARDKKCVYCGKTMLNPWSKKNIQDSVTIEHLNHKPDWDCVVSYKKQNRSVSEIIAICCGACNSSRGSRSLRVWFTMSYCLANNINYSTVAKVVRDYMDEYESDQNKQIGEWKNAKTYEKIAPHEYIVQEEQPKLYKKYVKLIAKMGKEERFTLHGKTNVYRYYYEGDYKYWVLDNILNRAKCINKDL